MLNKTLLFMIISGFFFSFNQLHAYAESMGDSQYILQFNIENNVNQNSQPVINNNQTPTYNLQSGFTNGSSLSPFTFSIDSDIIDFGIISATNPVNRSSTITVSNAQMGYQVLSSENHQLKTSNNQFIPDTTCDDGTPCTDTFPGIWASIGTFGFGYHCENVNNSICDNSYPNKKLFKHFADSALGENSQQIVQNINKSITEDQATVTYKVNISGNQQNGVYTNVVNYLAVPNY